MAIGPLQPDRLAWRVAICITWRNAWDFGSERDGALATEHRLRLTLSCDHRVVDGVQRAQWLAAVRELIEAPLQLML